MRIHVRYHVPEIARARARVAQVAREPAPADVRVVPVVRGDVQALVIQLVGERALTIANFLA